MTHSLWVIVHSKIKFKKPNTFNNTRIEHRLRHFWYRWLRCSLLYKIKYNSGVLIGQNIIGLKRTVMEKNERFKGVWTPEIGRSWIKKHAQSFEPFIFVDIFYAYQIKINLCMTVDYVTTFKLDHVTGKCISVN